MAKLTLRYVQAFPDRHGKLRHYFRRSGYPRVALPGLPGSREFMEAYQAALNGSRLIDRIGLKSRVSPGTMNFLITAYYGSAEFRTLAPLTQSTYRNVIERWRTAHGHLSIAGLQAKHMRKMLDDLSEKPAAAYNLRRVLRILMRFAVERDYRPDNPSLSIRSPRRKTEGYRSWTEADIAKFEAHWEHGTRARLALALLLGTAQRRSDVVTMGRQHIRDGKMQVVQQKTGTRLSLPVPPTLLEALAHAPKDQMTFLTTATGKPMTPQGFTNWFIDCARDAGLPPKSSPHGLRKAAARRLAEAGCSAHEIMAVTGHTSLTEVATYTRAADQERLAQGAMDAVDKARTGTGSVKP